MLNKTVGATLLVAGTCIGAGMLALPVSTAASGFYWSGGLIVLAWLLMMITGLMVVEVNVWLKGRASYITMAEKTLGWFGKSVTWVLFLMLLYALMAAYISGGAALIIQELHQRFSIDISEWLGLMPWVLVFGFAIYWGTTAVDMMNKALVFGLILCFILTIVFLAPDVKWQPAELPVHGAYIFAALPYLMTSYGYHIIIPTVSNYLEHDAKKLRLVVVAGSVVALVVYLFWEYLVFGIVPYAGEQGLSGILASGQPAATLTEALSFHANNSVVKVVVELFTFFALCSSFIGVALGLFHLLGDGVKSANSVPGRIMTALLTFLPPMFFALYYPAGFITALGYAGVLVALIHGVLPALMVWRGRYHLSLSQAGSYRVFGGKCLLSIVIILSLVVLGAEIVGHWGVIPKL